MKLDKNDPLMCEGIVGDGCGGGRIFFIRENQLFAHDPMTKEDKALFTVEVIPKKLFKKGCILSLQYEQHAIEFDLSLMTQRIIKF